MEKLGLAISNFLQFVCCSYQNTIRLSCVHNIVFWNSFHLLLITNQSLDVISIGGGLNRSKKKLKKLLFLLVSLTKFLVNIAKQSEKVIGQKIY